MGYGLHLTKVAKDNLGKDICTSSRLAYRFLQPLFLTFNRELMSNKCNYNQDLMNIKFKYLLKHLIEIECVKLLKHCILDEGQV